MRTFFWLLVLVLVVGVAAGFYVGVFTVSADHQESTYAVSLAMHTDVVKVAAHSVEDRAGQISANVEENIKEQVTPPALAADAKGRIVSVNPDKNELVVTENVKNLTFKLNKDGKVFINDKEGALADLRAGDEATVSYIRQGQQLIAGVVRSTRK